MFGIAHHGGHSAAHRHPSDVLYTWLERISLWRHRFNSRQDLADLDEHLLKDIGLDAVQVRNEVEKPFWRA